ncbi:hypothetical protein PPERSA_01778 [Pseudocohnilembus persalinus]|uniref:Opioid growth factor receptor (OGFr) conserved domain-containing protein n=1 Tax=Pseudocohnilembus persalinus TaxID=266149 RepID=A0A0V0R1R9_PSEPJ|nr:hypothetical protein PPERSA_01778 [Pseudocohnilembus persalinus]|eukprot:KRX08317.1 hypothetical protein PPERSA_01778 [Pseudocohnilembus persalinus]
MLPNVNFFKNIKTKSSYMMISDILARKGNYKLLEQDHSYIQWLFPNKYKSAFNSSSYSLTDEEIKIFKTDKQIAENYVQGYIMFLDFLGFDLISLNSGQIQRGQNFLERANQAFIVNTHNHLRIRRLLCSLNNTGFRKYAIELVEFLNNEAKNKLDSPIYKMNSQNNRLLKIWNFYGQIDATSKKELELFQINNLISLSQAEQPSIFFDQFSQQNTVQKIDDTNQCETKQLQEQFQKINLNNEEQKNNQ